MNTDRHLKNELSELAAERNARKIKELREGSIEKPIDWQQVRIQASIAAMQGITSNPYFIQEFDRISKTVEDVRKRAAIISVEFADALVKELKGKE